MADVSDADRLHALGMFASALAGRPVAVAPLQPGEPSWTDGQTVFIDRSARPRAKLESVAVHASMIAADSLAPEVVGSLVRHSRLARRYLTVEGHRALAANADLLPGVLNSLADPEMASRSDSPAASLSIASGKDSLDEPPAGFGVIRAKKVIAANSRAAPQVDHDTAGHAPRRESKEALEELDDDEMDDTDDPDLFTSPVGGGGFIGKWLKKMLSSTRKSGGSGGGPPGADSPTHRTNSANRGAYAVSSTATVNTEDDRRHRVGRVHLSRMGRQPQELPTGLVHRARGRAAKSRHPHPGDRRARSECGARWHASAWDSIVATASFRATTSTSMPRSRHAWR